MQINRQTDYIATQTFDPDKIISGEFGKLYLTGISGLKPTGQVYTT
jgi:hypothetical protein